MYILRLKEQNFKMATFKKSKHISKSKSKSKTNKHVKSRKHFNKSRKGKSMRGGMKDGMGVAMTADTKEREALKALEEQKMFALMSEEGKIEYMHAKQRERQIANQAATKRVVNAAAEKKIMDQKILSMQRTHNLTSGSKKDYYGANIANGPITFRRNQVGPYSVKPSPLSYEQARARVINQESKRAEEMRPPNPAPYVPPRGQSGSPSSRRGRSKSPPPPPVPTRTYKPQKPQI